MTKILTRTDEQRFILDAVSWKSYEYLLRAFDERRVRITYDRGRVEIMTVSFMHERIKHLLGLLIVSLAIELGQNIAGGGSMTFKRRKKRRGLEPDECFWIQNEHLLRGKDMFDWEHDPPPDLALEVEITRSALKRLRIYAALGIPEVWRWTGKDMVTLVLDVKGKYQECTTSRAFPFFRPATLTHFLSLASTQGESGMISAFRAWVQQQVANDWPTA
jgi:Uma2 family endonuclease